MKYLEFNVVGYQFNNFNAFNAANNQCKSAMGIPHPSDLVTKEAIAPEISYTVDEEIDFYYCTEDLAPVLGPMKPFTIRIKVPDDTIGGLEFLKDAPVGQRRVSTTPEKKLSLWKRILRFFGFNSN